MILKINREACIKKFPTFPLQEYNPEENEFIDYYPKTFASYVLTLSAKSYIGQFKLLGSELTNLTNYMGENELIFLGDLKTPWLSQDHDFKKAKEGLEYLVDNKIGKKFNGGLQIDANQLPTFVKHLCWLVRLNAIVPYVHFIDPKQNLIGSICQYGNLHISTISKKSDNIVKRAIAKTKLQYSSDGRCYNKYSKTGAIKGRKWIS